MVSRSHGRVRAASAYPPHRSTTGSPSTVTAKAAPTSPFAKFRANASRTRPNRGAHSPCTRPSLVIDAVRRRSELKVCPPRRSRRTRRVSLQDRSMSSSCPSRPSWLKCCLSAYRLHLAQLVGDGHALEDAHDLFLRYGEDRAVRRNRFGTHPLGQVVVLRTEAGATVELPLVLHTVPPDDGDVLEGQRCAVQGVVQRTDVVDRRLLELAKATGVAEGIDELRILRRLRAVGDRHDNQTSGMIGAHRAGRVRDSGRIQRARFPGGDALAANRWDAGRFETLADRDHAAAD